MEILITRYQIITTFQGSCGKVMFSQISVCPLGVGISGPMSFLGVPSPFEGWVCPGEGTPQTWNLNLGYHRIWLASGRYASFLVIAAIFQLEFN